MQIPSSEFFIEAGMALSAVYALKNDKAYRVEASSFSKLEAIEEFLTKIAESAYEGLLEKSKEEAESNPQPEWLSRALPPPVYIIKEEHDENTNS